MAHVIPFPHPQQAAARRMAQAALAQGEGAQVAFHYPNVGYRGALEMMVRDGCFLLLPANMLLNWPAGQVITAAAALALYDDALENVRAAFLEKYTSSAAAVLNGLVHEQNLHPEADSILACLANAIMEEPVDDAPDLELA